MTRGDRTKSTDLEGEPREAGPTLQRARAALVGGVSALLATPHPRSLRGGGSASVVRTCVRSQCHRDLPGRARCVSGSVPRGAG